MFSSLKSFTSAIHAAYTVSPIPSASAGPWKIHEATSKKTKKAYSVFIFDRKSLDGHGNSIGRSGAAAFKRATEEVVERLRKEASSLARLRHPNILELVEPVEETRGGGLQFVTEPVTASLAGLLAEKDGEERGSGGRGSGRGSSRTTTELELELDELEVQKGLLQVSKALEFLHEKAGLVHSNLTPDAVLVNAKSDWKISGLAFARPSQEEGSDSPTNLDLSSMLNPDPRLPRFVQLNLDYSSPDLVLDHNVTAMADMFSLGLLCVALYNSPHRSPLDASSSISTYKRLFASASTTPSPSNSFLSSRSLPRDLSVSVLPRLITRRPAQRLTAREFQESEYFDNILVSTIRFLDSFPAKTPSEKNAFMRGLVRVLPSFPKSVMEKKLLAALVEELKDKELQSLILQNIFKIIDLLGSSAKRAFGDTVRARLKQLFVSSSNAKQSQPQSQPQTQTQQSDRDPSRDAGLMVVLDHLSIVTRNVSAKEFKDDILPIILTAIESPNTPALVDASLRRLPEILPMLDFSTIKNELFPVVAAVFARTNSLAIKVRALQAFAVLCGAPPNSADDDDVSWDKDRNDGLDGLAAESGSARRTSATALDKYTMQEKIMPLIKAIKTKEPAVMLAALNVLRVVGEVADAELVAFEIIPVLWAMSLGPLLDLKQFRRFMALIRKLERRVEDEQTKKLLELEGGSGGTERKAGGEVEDFFALGNGFGDSAAGVSGTGSGGGGSDDFESLVKGRATGGGVGGGGEMAPGNNNNNNNNSSSFDPWGTADVRARSPAVPAPKTQAPAFSWSTPSPTMPTTSTMTAPKPQPQQSFRTVTPDLARFEALTPSATQFSKPLQPTPPTSQAAPNPWASASNSVMGSMGSMGSMTNRSNSMNSMSANSNNNNNTNTPTMASNPWGSSSAAAMGGMNAMGTLRTQSSSNISSFSLAPPPGGPSTGRSAIGPGLGGGGIGGSGFSLPPPPGPGSAGASPGAGSFGTSFGGQQPVYGKGLGGGQHSGMGMGGSIGMNMGTDMGMRGTNGSAQKTQTPTQPQGQPQRSGLDKYESLI